MPFTDSRSFKDAYHRFKFSVKKSGYMDHLEAIQQNNTRLNELTKQSMPEPMRTSNGRGINFEKFRLYALSVFNTLQRTLHSSCTSAHTASLCIKAPTIERPQKSARDDRALRLVLHHEHASSSWLSKEAEVKPLEAPSVDSQATAGAASRSHSSRIRVQFMASSVLPAMTGAASTGSGGDKMSEIHDLCESMARICLQSGGDSCLGYMVDTVSDARHGVYWPAAPLVDDFMAISLAKLMETQASSKLLSVADSRQLATSLAFGILQLHDTPWLAQKWNPDDIVFFKDTAGLLAKHPFVSVRLRTSNAISSPSSSPSISLNSFPVPANEAVFALGVLLIELCLEAPFDKLRIPVELSPDGSKHRWSDRMTAERLLPKVYDTAGWRYVFPISCICNVQRRSHPRCIR